MYRSIEAGVLDHLTRLRRRDDRLLDGRVVA